MKRRDALKNLGFGLGAIVATPTVLSLFQSCKNEPTFTPVFLTAEQAYALGKLVDLIIPKDDAIEGAKALGIHKFIDAYWNEVPDAEGKALINLGLTTLATTFKSTFNTPIAEGSTADFEQLLQTYLNAPKATQKAYETANADFVRVFASDPKAIPDAKATTFGILHQIRGLAIWGFKLNETIAENVLWYDPVPSAQKGCIDISEAGNGMASALS